MSDDRKDIDPKDPANADQIEEQVEPIAALRAREGWRRVLRFSSWSDTRIKHGIARLT